MVGDMAVLEWKRLLGKGTEACHLLCLSFFLPFIIPPLLLLCQLKCASAFCISISISLQSLSVSPRPAVFSRNAHPILWLKMDCYRRRKRI